ADLHPRFAREETVGVKGVVDGDAGVQVRVVGQVGVGANTGGLNARLVGRLGLARADAAAAQGPTVFQRAVGIARPVGGERRAAHAEHVGRHGGVFRVEAATVASGSDK